MADDLLPEHLEKKLTDAKNVLMEHFDSCRIFVTLHEDDSKNTGAYTVGGGNFYAQRGNIQEWMNFMDERERIYEQTRHEENDDSKE